MSKYRIVSGKRFDQPLVGTLCFTELDHSGGNPTFIRVTYSCRRLVLGVILDVDGGNLAPYKGMVYAFENCMYGYYQAEELSRDP